MQHQHLLFEGWPALSLGAAELELILLPAPGGRLISLRFRGVELLYRDPCLRQIAPSKAKAAYGDPGFPLWGGDKTWIAPQSDWSNGKPFVDLDAGEYSVQEEVDGVLMRSPICAQSGLQLQRRLQLSAPATLNLEESIVNHGAATRRCGVWNVSQFLRPAQVFLPAPIDHIIAYSGEGQSVELKASRVTPAAEAWSAIDCKTAAHFKFGCRSPRGAAYALFDGRIACERSFETDGQAQFAHGANHEVYNSPDRNYLELESHGPCVDLQPGETTKLQQRWRFAPVDGAASLTELIALFAG